MYLRRISGKRDQHVVKCVHCNEATPVKNAPAGKKYVRCPCNCLLICKSSSIRIACPRVNCKRIINLAPSPITPPTNLSPGMSRVICVHCSDAFMVSVPTNLSPGMSRVICVHCSDAFMFNTLNNALARCPHCRKVSSVGPDFARGRSTLFFTLGIFFLLLGICVTYGSYKYAISNGGGIYIAYIGAFIIALVSLIRGVYYPML
ncbi:type 2 phosphatidylinositol 4,5-bisphosphate 4-phosphatase [Diaphorina citri]|uniref:Phosphatidylinositol-4,5-bisphosphate 4-phosphatase n=1 Tax=Diaphorina citri TaxID=121845 RepID=A0A3Q0JD25_DIACI|nr:type 2 phosphatidylinositol 4,5-bisphosphate 4-phosphatase [Diaphorina citri]